ncbi:MAG TPA: DUF1003 domain-containing protein, partial [Ilumatobacteraceae bacterium]|nr:DUF1003 domain-containing protein [Ilumatobacteraceae bacterium]
DLSAPRQPRRIGLHYDPEAFGQFSESIARTLGTARFLVWQTLLIGLWLTFNYLMPEVFRFDGPEQGFVRLTLILSVQSAYAAPLILLAQNRQEARDRNMTDSDRRVAERTQADTEYLARELASVRLALSGVVTTEDLRDSLAELTAVVEKLSARLDGLDGAGSDAGFSGGVTGGADVGRDAPHELGRQG